MKWKIIKNRRKLGKKLTGMRKIYRKYQNNVEKWVKGDQKLLKKQQKLDKKGSKLIINMKKSSNSSKIDQKSRENVKKQTNLSTSVHKKCQKRVKNWLYQKKF